VSAQATFRNGCAALSPGDLTRARTDGITGPAACGVNGLESGIHHDPLARFAPASSGSAPAALPWALAAGAVSCCSLLAGHLRACGRLSSGGRRHGEQHSRGSQTERFRKWAHRHGHNLFRGQPPARRQSQRTVCARRSSLREFFPRDRGPLTVDSPRPGCGRPGEEFHVEPSRQIEPRAAGNPRSAGGPWSTRAMDPRRSRQAFHVEPDGIGRGYPQTGSTR